MSDSAHRDIRNTGRVLLAALQAISPGFTLELLDRSKRRLRHKLSDAERAEKLAIRARRRAERDRKRDQRRKARR
jgi:hypothetical protein